MRLGLAGFSGPLALDNKGQRGSRKIYQNLKAWAGPGNTRYLLPGQVLFTPGSLGLTTYVFGPPRDKDLLFKALPSRGDKAETYFTAQTGNSCEEAESHSPFAPRHRWRSFERIKNFKDGNAPEALVRDRYFAPQNPRTAHEFDGNAVQSHRRIDDVARSVFSTLSLKMDNKTNNTSLVLVFELPDQAGTLLFAADAQVGNWLSWEKVEFREDPNDEPLAITSSELLARARLYKVGHHGSHNATLRQKGLDLMRHPELVALIPTDADFAKRQSGGWLMPNPRVENALVGKTRGRVLRGDRAASEAVEAHKELCGPEAASAFESRLTDTDLYVEYTVYDRTIDGRDD
jgi:hypothetical protein